MIEVALVCGLLVLGLYCAKRMFDLLDEHSRRLAVQRTPQQIVVPSPQPAQAMPPVPSDLSNDETWDETQAMWAREAIELQKTEEARIEVIQRSLTAARERRAAQLAAQGMLAATPAEPTAPDVPSAGSP